MTARDALIGLNFLPEVGPLRLKKLTERFARPQHILRAPIGELCRSGISGAIARRIRALTPAQIANEKTQADRLGIAIITLEDEAYPQLLKSIYDPPAVLYVKGDPGVLGRRCIAVVGSRVASFYGQKYARQFSGALATAGFCVVSGMARGIDSCAHRGTLEAQGATVAVMGSGFKYLYPPENTGLAEEIARTGAVVTEYALDTGVRREHFPRRNRIISGLSEGVFVVEARRTSGALITADCALEQGREVFALPGQIDTATADGTNELIRQGAQPVLAPEDILDALMLPQIVPSASGVSPEAAVEMPQAVATGAVLTADEQAVRRLCAAEPLGIDELIEKSGMDIPRISGILLHLQIKKIIDQLPGKHYRLL